MYRKCKISRYKKDQARRVDGGLNFSNMRAAVALQLSAFATRCNPHHPHMQDVHVSTLDSLGSRRARHGGDTGVIHLARGVVESRDYSRFSTT